MQLPLPLADIFDKFNGKLVGNEHMQYHVCEVLSFMDSVTVDLITSNCYFMASMEDAWAFTFTGNDLKDKHLIFLSDDLLTQNNSQIHYTIAHEIGHVVLKHRNSTFVKQSEEEIDRQEKEADIFAKKYI